MTVLSAGRIGLNQMVARPPIGIKHLHIHQAGFCAAGFKTSVVIPPWTMPSARATTIQIKSNERRNLAASSRSSKNRFACSCPSEGGRNACSADDLRPPRYWRLTRPLTRAICLTFQSGALKLSAIMLLLAGCLWVDGSGVSRRQIHSPSQTG